MFHNIPKSVTDRMEYLQNRAAEDKAGKGGDRIPLWQVPTETGKLLAILAASAPEGQMIEIGTSGGFSGLWQSLAASATGRHITTFELEPEKVELATETFKTAKVADKLTIVQGDIRENLDKVIDVSFCFLDASKNVYQDCYDTVVPRMVSGGLLVADNMISHEDELTEFWKYVQKDDRVDALIDPIGSGLLIARKL